MVLTLQGLNLNENPVLSFAVKLSQRDAKHIIRKGILISLHLSGTQGWPHGPGYQPYTPHHKLPFLSINISLILKLLKCDDSKNYNILSFSWIFQPSVNSVITQNLGDVLIILIICCLCSRLIITNHCGSSDIHQLAVCPASDVEKFKVLLHCSLHYLRKTI